MRRMAKTAVRFVVAARVRVRHHLQQEEERNQRERERNTGGQPAILPDTCRSCCSACQQKAAFQKIVPSKGKARLTIVVYKQRHRKKRK